MCDSLPGSTATRFLQLTALVFATSGACKVFPILDAESSSDKWIKSNGSRLSVSHAFEKIIWLAQALHPPPLHECKSSFRSFVRCENLLRFVACIAALSSSSEGTSNSGETYPSSSESGARTGPLTLPACVHNEYKGMPPTHRSKPHALFLPLLFFILQLPFFHPPSAYRLPSSITPPSPPLSLIHSSPSATPYTSLPCPSSSKTSFFGTPVLALRKIGLCVH